MTLALFDMDRTLVRKDTATLFARYRRDQGEASFVDMARLAWWLFQYSLGVVNAERVAERALRDFRGTEERRMIDMCEEWFVTYVLPHVTDAGRRAVAKHHERGDTVAIVTGATPYAARPLARELGIDHVVCTELEVDSSGRFTGKVVKPMCYGDGKLARASRFASTVGHDLRAATFYTDSCTDLPLLRGVGQRVIVNPDRRLRRVALRETWTVEHW